MMSLVQMIAVFLSLAVSALALANASEPRFHPAPGAMPVIGSYVVTLADSMAEDLLESSVRGDGHDVQRASRAADFGEPQEVRHHHGASPRADAEH
jgi:hypothetical protein